MEKPKCPYCGHEMMYLYEKTKYWFVCELCGASSPLAYTLDEARAAAMKREKVKGSMSLYIYKKLGEWLGAPCNLSFGELHVDEFFTRYCGNFCDDCNSEYEKCWKKFFETLMNDEAALNERIKEEEDAVKIWERAGKCICCYQQQQEEHRQLANWLKELRRLRTEVEVNDER